jgi:hypothetical protein
MSRTYKDRHWKLRFPESHWEFGTVRIEYDDEERGYIRCSYLHAPGVKTKKRRDIDVEYHWVQGTPSWWTNLFMNRPMRRKGRAWERKVLFEEDIEETDPPGVSHKPHKYYW